MTSNFTLKCFNIPLLRHLSTIFNHCINYCYFPLYWKHCKIIPTLKPNSNPNHLHSYRPRAILSAISMLFEKVITKNLVKQIKSSNLLKNTQYGFGEGITVNHALMATDKFIFENIHRRRATIACENDFEKGFYTVGRATRFNSRRFRP